MATNITLVEISGFFYAFELSILNHFDDVDIGLFYSASAV